MPGGPKFREFVPGPAAPSDGPGRGLDANGFPINRGSDANGFPILHGSEMPTASRISPSQPTARASEHQPHRGGERKHPKYFGGVWEPSRIPHQPGERHNGARRAHAPRG